MTGQKILEDALRYAAADGYQVLAGVDYINAAVDLIIKEYDEIGIISEHEFIINNTNVSNWIELPNAFLTERRMYLTDASSTLINAINEPYFYLIQNDKIRFDFEGKYTLEYLSIPDDITLLTDEPNVPKLYHRAISYYLAYRIRVEIFGDEENAQDKFLMQFYDGINKAYGRLSRRKRRRFVKVSPWS